MNNLNYFVGFSREKGQTRQNTGKNYGKTKDSVAVEKIP